MYEACSASAHLYVRDVKRVFRLGPVGLADSFCEQGLDS